MAVPGSDNAMVSAALMCIAEWNGKEGSEAGNPCPTAGLRGAKRAVTPYAVRQNSISPPDDRGRFSRNSHLARFVQSLGKYVMYVLCN